MADLIRRAGGHLVLDVQSPASLVLKLAVSEMPGAAVDDTLAVTLDGEPLTAAELGLNNIEDANATVIKGSESATLRPTNAEYTISTGKIHLIDSATGKEVESTKDMSKVVVRLEAYGT